MAAQPCGLLGCACETRHTGVGEAFYPWALSALVRSLLRERVVGDPAPPLLAAVGRARSGLLFRPPVHAAAVEVVVGLLLEFTVQQEVVLLRLVIRGGGKPGLLHGAYPEALRAVQRAGLFRGWKGMTRIGKSVTEHEAVKQTRAPSGICALGNRLKTQNK